MTTKAELIACLTRDLAAHPGTADEPIIWQYLDRSEVAWYAQNDEPIDKDEWIAFCNGKMNLDIMRSTKIGEELIDLVSKWWNERNTKLNLMEEIKKAAEGDELYVVAIGNAWDGLGLHGPFTESDDAMRWVESIGENDDWHVVTLNPVELEKDE